MLLLQKKNAIAAPARRQVTPTPTPTPMPIVALLERPLDDEDEGLAAAVLVAGAVELEADALVADEVDAVEVVDGLDWSPVMLK